MIEIINKNKCIKDIALGSNEWFCNTNIKILIEFQFR